MRKGRKLVIAVKCDYCKTETESFVCDAQGLRFCRIQTPGYPPDKDCQAEHTRNKNVQKKRKRKRLILTKRNQLLKRRNSQKYPSSPILLSKSESKYSEFAI
jgi:uncharacterized protein with PIN domain